MIINHNMMALNTLNRLSAISSMQARSIERLSTGQRINRAADDPAGLVISEKMRAQIRGLNQAVRNAQDSISMIQTAEGALGTTHDILQRMRELSVQAANGTLNLDDRRSIQEEMNQLIEEINNIAENTEFNTKRLLNGDLSSSGSPAKIQIGANSGQTTEIDINPMDASNLSSSGLDTLIVSDVWNATSGGILTPEGAKEALEHIDEAIGQVSSERAKLGARQNRLEHTINNLTTTSENLQAAESRIRDVDMAKEMIRLTKLNLLQQVAQAMLVQANKAPEAILALLKQ